MNQREKILAAAVLVAGCAVGRQDVVRSIQRTRSTCAARKWKTPGRAWLMRIARWPRGVRHVGRWKLARALVAGRSRKGIVAVQGVAPGQGQGGRAGRRRYHALAADHLLDGVPSHRLSNRSHRLAVVRGGDAVRVLSQPAVAPDHAAAAEPAARRVAASSHARSRSAEPAGAVATDSLPEGESKRLKLASVAEYQKSLTERDLASVYTPPRPPREATARRDPPAAAEVRRRGAGPSFGGRRQRQGPAGWINVRTTGETLHVAAGDPLKSARSKDRSFRSSGGRWSSRAARKSSAWRSASRCAAAKSSKPRRAHRAIRQAGDPKDEFHLHCYGCRKNAEIAGYLAYSNCLATVRLGGSIRPKLLRQTATPAARACCTPTNDMRALRHVWRNVSGRGTPQMRNVSIGPCRNTRSPALNQAWPGSTTISIASKRSSDTLLISSPNGFSTTSRRLVSR